MSVENKIEGISGRDKMCTLQPFEIIEVLDKDGKPDPPVEEPPIEDDDLVSLIKKLIALLKKLFKL
jgi:hypothetical protein